MTHITLIIGPWHSPVTLASEAFQLLFLPLSGPAPGKIIYNSLLLVFLGFVYLFCFINHVHHFLDALQMLRYLHWVQISFILSCSTLFFSIVYHLHKMYLSCMSFFQNLRRCLGNLILQHDALCLFVFPTKI